MLEFVAGYGQGGTDFSNMAGHDNNYIALSGRARPAVNRVDEHGSQLGGKTETSETAAQMDGFPQPRSKGLQLSGRTSGARSDQPGAGVLDTPKGRS